MIVVKAKKVRQIATRMFPAIVPNTVPIAVCIIFALEISVFAASNSGVLRAPLPV